jgi:hypothetical protein
VDAVWRVTHTTPHPLHTTHSVLTDILMER